MLNPATLPGIVAWYDAADDQSFEYGTGTAVATWKDKSGNGNHLTQATSGNRPTRSGTRNGRSTVVFDGTDDVLARTGMSFDQRCTVFAVVYLVATSGEQSIVKFDGQDYILWVTTTEQVGAYLDNNWSNAPGSAAGQAGMKVLTSRQHTADRRVRVDGVESVGTNTVASGTATTIELGMSTTRPLASEICEVIVVSDQAAPLGNHEINAVERYLATKWGVPISPQTVPGLRAWYDASDITSLTYGSDGTVSQWNDKSGNARHLTQGTAANRPKLAVSYFDNLHTVRFDGTDDALSASSWGTVTQPAAYVIVLRRFIQANNKYLFQGGHIVYSSGTTGNVLLNAGSNSGPTWTEPAKQWIGSFLFDGASSKARQNGAETTHNPGTASSTSFILGNSSATGVNCYNISVGELLVYDGDVSSYIPMIESHLRAKWGTA